MWWLLIQSFVWPQGVVSHHTSRIQVDAGQSPMTSIVHGDPHLCAQPTGFHRLVSDFESRSAVLVRGITILHPVALMSARTELHSSTASDIQNPDICGTNYDVVVPATHHGVKVGAEGVVSGSLVVLLTKKCRSHGMDCFLYVLSVTRTFWSTFVSELMLFTGMDGRPTLSVHGEAMEAEKPLFLSSVTRVPIATRVRSNSSICGSELCHSLCVFILGGWVMWSGTLTVDSVGAWARIQHMVSIRLIPWFSVSPDRAVWDMSKTGVPETRSAVSPR